MLKLRSLWLVVIIALIAVTVTPVLAQETYTAPTGQFSTQIPAGWSDQSNADYGLLTSDDTSVYVLVEEGDDVQTGIEAAIQRVAPDFASVKISSNDLPAPNGVWTQNVYGEASGKLQIALAQVSEDKTYVILIMLPSQSALLAKQADINSIVVNASVGVVIDLSAQQPAVLDDAALADISAYVSDSMANYGIVGAAVAIVQDGAVVYADGFGTLGQDDADARDRTRPCS